MHATVVVVAGQDDPSMMVLKNRGAGLHALSCYTKNLLHQVHETV